MLIRRTAATIGLLALVAGCSDNTGNTGPAPQPADAPDPHFVRWEGSAAPELSAEGAAASGMGGRNRPFLGAPVDAAAPTVDRSTSATLKAASLSWSHTIGTGMNRLLVVGVAVEDGRTVTAVTYRGASLTSLGAKSESEGNRVEFWYLKAPTPGTGTVKVSLNGKANMVGGAVSFFGTDQVAPFGNFVGNSSSGTKATVGTKAAANEVVISVLAIDGRATSRTPTAGHTALWNRVSSEADVAGGASLATGTGSEVSMSWDASVSGPWALGAVAIHPVPLLSLTKYQAQFWAVRGQSRTLSINYAAGGGTSPFMQLTVADPAYVPGRGNLALGDSVLMTATVDPNAIVVQLEPSGLEFGTPAQLKIWYGGSGGDLNGDGVVNSTDAFIETKLLGMWYQADPGSPWSRIWATKSLTEKSFTAALAHFSGYAISW